MRAFGHSLAGHALGEDLAQDAAMRAWKARTRYQPGTSMKAWTFTILRNLFLSEKRRSWRSVSLDPTVAEAKLVANDDAEAAEHLLDLHAAMQQLPVDQREVLILVGSAGLTYEQAAEICGCAVGTVKSRISRGRNALAEILAANGNGRRKRSSETTGTIFETMLAEANLLSSRLAPMA